MLPRRGEKLADGINVASRPARVRMRFRTDVTPDMRFVIDGRVMQIIAGPAELSHREGLDFMVEEYSPAGNPACWRRYRGAARSNPALLACPLRWRPASLALPDARLPRRAHGSQRPAP